MKAALSALLVSDKAVACALLWLAGIGIWGAVLAFMLSVAGAAQ